MRHNTWNWGLAWLQESSAFVQFVLRVSVYYKLFCKHCFTDSDELESLDGIMNAKKGAVLICRTDYKHIVESPF